MIYIWSGIRLNAKNITNCSCRFLMLFFLVYCFLPCLFLEQAFAKRNFFPITGTQALENFLTSIYSGRGRFKQINLKKNEISTNNQKDSNDICWGSFQFLRPNFFIWIYEKPYFQHLQSDGKSFFLYDKDLNQVIKRKVNLNVDANLFAVLFGKNRTLDDLEEKYQIMNFFSKENNFFASDLVWVKLEPREKSIESSIIYIGFSLEKNYAKLSRLKFDSGVGTSIELILINVKQNIRIAKNIFQFLVPAEADLIEE